MKVLVFMVMLFCGLFLGAADNDTVSDTGVSPDAEMTDADQVESPAGNDVETQQKKQPAFKVLVVYFSHTGNTRKIAQQIAQGFSADVEEVKEVGQDRSGFFGYMGAGMSAMMGSDIEISQLQYDPSQYDIVIVGTPIWAWSVTPAIRAYLKQTEGKIKKAAYFTTSGGTAPDNIVKEMEDVSKVSALSMLGILEDDLKKDTWETKVSLFISDISNKLKTK